MHPRFQNDHRIGSFPSPNPWDKIVTAPFKMISEYCFQIRKLCYVFEPLCICHVSHKANSPPPSPSRLLGRALLLAVCTFSSLHPFLSEQSNPNRIRQLILSLSLFIQTLMAFSVSNFMSDDLCTWEFIDQSDMIDHEADLICAEVQSLDSVSLFSSDGENEEEDEETIDAEIRDTLSRAVLAPDHRTQDVGMVFGAKVLSELEIFSQVPPPPFDSTDVDEEEEEEGCTDLEEEEQEQEEYSTDLNEEKEEAGEYSTDDVEEEEEEDSNYMDGEKEEEVVEEATYQEDREDETAAGQSDLTLHECLPADDDVKDLSFNDNHQHHHVNSSVRSVVMSKKGLRPIRIDPVSVGFTTAYIDQDHLLNDYVDGMHADSSDIDDLVESDDDDSRYDLDDELVPWGVSKKFEKQRIRKLGKRSCTKMAKSKRFGMQYSKPGCLRGKHGLGLKA